MQVVFRNLLAVSFLVWGASCALNDSGLGGTDAKGSRDGGALTGGAGSSAAGTSGAAGSSAPAGGGGTGTIPTGVAGDGAGAAGTTSAGGAGGDSSSGVAGDSGTPGAGGSTNGTAGTSVAGHSGTAGTGAAGTGAAGTGAAGTGAAGTGAAGTGSAGTGAAGTGAAGTAALGQVGCADNSREGFTDRAKYPKIAACSGGWEEPGLTSPDSKIPQCDRRAGNDGDRTDGRGCSVTDLCASGWHVCESAKIVETNAGTCADAVSTGGDSMVFFVTRQRGTSSGNTVICDAPQPGTNNLFGCGSIGNAPDKTCAPLTRTLRDIECAFPWTCAEGPLGTSQNELGVVTKRGSMRGGVLCCKD